MKQLKIYADGSKYHGEMTVDKPHGYGVWIFTDGTSFEGEWVEGKPSGNGVWTLSNGSKKEILGDKLYKMGLQIGS